MSDLLEKEPSIRHYFVDEAGDPTLFNSKGKVIIQSEGCSRFFMLGALDVVEPESLIRNLEELRSDLLADHSLLPRGDAARTRKVKSQKSKVKSEKRDTEQLNLFMKNQKNVFRDA